MTATFGAKGSASGPEFAQTSRNLLSNSTVHTCAVSAPCGYLEQASAAGIVGRVVCEPARIRIVPPHSELPTVGRPWGVWFSTASSTLLPRHEHDYAELNLILSGSVAYRLDAHSPPLEAQAGQLIAIPPGASHELMRSSPDLTLWVIELKDADPPPWLSQPVAITPTDRWRKAALAVLRKLWLRPPLDDALELQTRFLVALGTIEKAHLPRSLALHPAVVQARSVCESASEQKLDISTIAHKSGLSAGRLAHLFADQVGITPLQYRNFAHVQRFIRTYDGDERNLLGAALRSGFGSYAQFHRAFRQVCGETPATHFRWLARSGEVDARRTLAYVAQPTSQEVCAPSAPLSERP